MVSQPLFFFPVMPSMSTLPEFVASSKRSSVLLCRSLCDRLSAHCTMRSALLCPQNLRCACDRVSLESCVSLGAMLSGASSLGICTSSGVRPNLVSNRLRHVFIFIHIMLIPIIVQYHPATHFFGSSHRTLTATTPTINVFSLRRLTALSSSSGHTTPTISDLSFSALILIYYLRLLLP